MADENAKKIMIIDDDRFLLDMYSVKFSEKGYLVEACEGAEAALAKIEGGYAPDICLTDIVMPNMDGFTLLEEINKRGLLKGVAKIILSNLGQKEDIERGRSLNVDGYIIKASATPSEVVARVGEILKNSK
jgi:CheY-like chemotaxis protein